VFNSGPVGARPDIASQRTANSHLLVLDNADALNFLSRPGSDCVRDVIFSLPDSKPDALKRAIGVVSEYAVNIHVFPDAPSMYFGNKVNLVNGLPVVTLSRRPLSSFQSAVKRCVDVAASGTLIVLLLPLLILIALAIKLDSKGPVLFRQSRHGYNNQPFQILKFRSMHPASEPVQAIIQAKRNDSRVTRVGRFLRRTSLDELPQIFNVLRGDMSLIGPRPHAVQHHAQYCDLVHGYRQRHRVKPGITGWAQVSGFRGETDTLDKMSRRINHDLYYIDNWSLGFDIKILFMTLVLGFINRNAY